MAEQSDLFKKGLEAARNALTLLLTTWEKLAPTFKKGLEATTPRTRALIVLGVTLFLMLTFSDWRGPSKATQQTQNKVVGFLGSQGKQLLPTPPSRHPCPEFGTPALQKASVLRKCIAEGLNPNTRLAGGMPILTVFAGAGTQHDTAAAIHILLEAGADVNAQSSEGDTALMLVSTLGRTAIVHILLEAGADVNAQNNEGDTALMFASMAGNTAIVQALLDARANVNAQNKEGQTAQDIAMKFNQRAVGQMLARAASFW